MQLLVDEKINSYWLALAELFEASLQEMFFAA